MKFYPLLLVLLAWPLWGQQGLERKGCLAFEASTLMNQNNKKAFYHNAGVSLSLDFGKVRLGGGMNFVMVDKQDQIFKGAFAPAFEYFLGYRLLNWSDNDIHFGLRGGMRTGVFNYDAYDNSGDIYTVPDLQTTSYLGPKLTYTHYFHPKIFPYSFLQVNFEINYMFALNAYSSDDRVFGTKIDKKQAMLGDAMHVKLQIGWGKDI